MVHFPRNVLARVPTTAQAMVAATVRTIVEQPDRDRARVQLGTVIAALQDRFPSVVELLTQAEAEVFTFSDFPAEHRRQIYSTTPLEMASSQRTIAA